MCKECEKNPVYVFTNKRQVCNNCFKRYFQKKFLYIIKKFEMIKKNDKIYLKEGKDLRSVVLKDLLINFERKAPIELVKAKNKATKIVVTNNIEVESKNIIDSIVRGKSKNMDSSFPKTKKEIKPLYLFLDKEIKLYAKLRGLKYKKDKEKMTKFSKFINSLEEKHPEIKRAIVNSYLEISG
jgi:hypothetical protein